MYINEQHQNLKEKESQALLSENGSRIFAKYKMTVEPIFRQIKAFLDYTLRGKQKVGIDMGLVLIASYLKKLSKNMAT